MMKQKVVCILIVFSLALFSGIPTVRCMSGHHHAIESIHYLDCPELDFLDASCCHNSTIDNSTFHDHGFCIDVLFVQSGLSIDKLKKTYANQSAVFSTNPAKSIRLNSLTYFDETTLDSPLCQLNTPLLN